MFQNVWNITFVASHDITEVINTQTQMYRKILPCYDHQLSVYNLFPTVRSSDLAGELVDHLPHPQA